MKYLSASHLSCDSQLILLISFECLFLTFSTWKNVMVNEKVKTTKTTIIKLFCFNKGKIRWIIASEGRSKSCWRSAFWMQTFKAIIRTGNKNLACLRDSTFTTNYQICSVPMIIYIVRRKYLHTQQKAWFEWKDRLDTL